MRFLLLLVGLYHVCCSPNKGGIPSKAAKLTSNLVTGTLKGTTKAGYYLVQPKHVEIEQVYGLWRLDIDDGVEDGGILNLEITPKHVVLLDPRHRERIVLSYRFKPAKWPVRARIEFETKQFAYQVVIHRKVAARNVLKLKGTIRQLGRWGSRREVVHTFRGMRRRQVKSVTDEESVDTENVNDDQNESNSLSDDSRDDNSGEESGDEVEQWDDEEVEEDEL